MNAIQRWSKSGLPIVIKNSQLTPIAKNKEICSQQGAQGTAYSIVQKSTGKEWIIKKFHQNCLPPKKYLKAIRKLLPDHSAFVSAKKRIVLVPDDLRNKPNNYHSFQLARWLENSILMQKVPGQSWKEISSEIRDGKRKIKKNRRIAIAKNLVDIVKVLESSDCAHRDLCHENLYIENENVSLVDWDTMYHSSLPYVKKTTRGTNGYNAPWTSSAKDSWKNHSDRFALGILISEILLMKIDERPTKEGVMFTDEILKHEQDPFVAQKVQKMYEYSENMGDLFLQCLTAKSFAECPLPQQWDDALHEIAPSKNRTKSKDKDKDKDKITIKVDSPPQGLLATSMTSIEKYQKAAQKSWIRWRHPVVLCMLLLLVLLLLLPWIINTDDTSSNKNKNYIANNNQNTQKNTEVTVANNTDNLNNINNIDNNTQNNLSKQPVEINNITPLENTKKSTKNNTNVTQNKTTNIKQPKIEKTPPKPVENFGLQEITNAKEFRLKILYADNDLKLIIANQQINVSKENKASVYLTPGVHTVKIHFSAIKFLKNGKQKAEKKTSFTKKVRFNQQNITIRINRLKKVWKVVK